MNIYIHHLSIRMLNEIYRRKMPISIRERKKPLLNNMRGTIGTDCDNNTQSRSDKLNRLELFVSFELLTISIIGHRKHVLHWPPIFSVSWYLSSAHLIRLYVGNNKIFEVIKRQ